MLCSYPFIFRFLVFDVPYHLLHRGIWGQDFTVRLLRTLFDGHVVLIFKTTFFGNGKGF